MNRQEYNELLTEVFKEIEEQKGNFQTLFRGEEMNTNDVKMIAAISLIAVDRYYAKLTKLKLDHPNI